jgi:DNA polymerase-1
VGLDLAAELREFYGTEVEDPTKELQEYYGRDWGDVVRDPGEAWDLLKGEEEVGFDLETGGLYPRRDPIAVVSLYGEKTTTPCIIHTRGSMPDAIREMFRWDHVRWTGHNIVSFDLHFLARYFGSWVWDLRTYDTLVGETVIIPTGRRDVSVSLQAATQRRLKVKIGKDADHRTWMNPTLTRTQVNYCVEDVVSLHKLRREQEQKAAERRLTKALDFEMALLPVVARMQWNGLPIDTVGLSSYLSDELVKADHAKSQLFATFGREINLNSVPQLRKALTDVGIPVPDTKAETLQSIVNFGGRKAEVLSNILDYRHAIKRNQVYKPSWVAENVQPHDGWYWIHAKWWQVGADTGRFTSSNPNLQQVPKHGSSMRQLFWVPGRTTVAGDYAQIEVRIAAHLANDRELLRVLVDEDVHRSVAASVFGIRPDQVTDEQRQLAKAMSFLFLFGGTAKKLYAYVQLAGQLDFTMARAQEVFDAFFRRFQGLWLMRLRAEDMASRGGSVSLEWPSGLRRRLYGHDLKSTVILNNSVQGTAASGIKKAMLECMKRGLWVWLGAQVHDELVCHPPEREAPEFAHELEEAMLEGMRWAVPDTPLKVEVSVARTWAGPKVA